MEEPFDEYCAYSVAAWHRFDEQVTEPMARAISGAFALIACADGELSESEVDALVEAVLTAGAVPGLEVARVERMFRDVCQAMLTDVEDGWRRALALIEPAKQDPAQAQLVAHAAQIAMYADGRVQEPELAALKKICTLLQVTLED